MKICIVSDSQLAKLRNSSIAAVLIDDAKGIGFDPGPSSASADEQVVKAKPAAQAKARKRAHLSDHALPMSRLLSLS